MSNVEDRRHAGSCPSHARQSVGGQRQPFAGGDRQTCSPISRTIGVVFLFAVLLILTGCGRDSMEHTYGRRRGTGGASVNGTGVLSQMFRQAGHNVHTRRNLSPKMESYDTIVWAPDDFSLPSEESQTFLEDWLINSRGRTLIFIGRDFDAEIAYWEHVRPSAPPEQMTEVTRRLAKARARHAKERLSMPEEEACRWFAVQRDEPRRQIGQNGGPDDALHGTWCDGGSIDVTKLDIVVEGRLTEPKDPPTGTFGGSFRSEVLLAAGRDVLVRRITNDDWPDSQIIVVTNGSFLLNLPLVEPEHRKLAARLVEQCGPPGKTAFVESGPYGISVYDSDRNNKYPTGLEVFTEWPIGFVLMHFVALGLVVLLCFVAIFGRPLELETGAISDFGRHVASVGQSLVKTQDQAYARRLLHEYHEQSKGETQRDPK